MKAMILFLLLIATAAQAETFTWTDKEGTVHFTDSRASIPAPYRKTAVSVADSGDAAGNPAQTVTEPGAGRNGAAGEQVEGLKERMMNDGGIISLITALQNDPEMQAVLNDPAVMKAVQSGDFATLMQSPAFMKLLQNPRVQEIQRKMLQQDGTR